MSTSWRDRFRKLHPRRKDAKRSHLSVTSERIPTAPLAINFGIDFGTSFTKVCFRDVATEETGIVGFSQPDAGDALIPSIVIIDEHGNLSLGRSDNKTPKSIAVHYLKMRLAGAQINRLPKMHDVDLNAEPVIAGLSSWFLATVLSQTQAWIFKNQSERTHGRSILWSANVGVPVEYYDSPLIERFREVLAVAWSWSSNSAIPSRIDNLATAYQNTSLSIDRQKTDCHALPEIAAAVQSFVTSREAQPDIYIYFDIGGGTVDGCAFRFLKSDGERRIDFYSGKVAHLGVAAIANEIGGQDPRKIEEILIGGTMNSSLKKMLDPFVERIQLLVSQVIMIAKRKDFQDWERAINENSMKPLKRLGGALDPSQMAPLRIFVGGGGANSAWYKRAILATYEAGGHMRAAIPPYALKEVPKPPDLDMTGLNAADFRRFAIAYGLSVPFGEGPEIGLPSQFANVEGPKERPLPPWVVGYLDQKDAYD